MNETLPDPLRALALRQPDAPALVASSETLTWADLDRRVDAAASWLRAQSLAPGDRVGIYRGLDADYIALLLAAFRTGIVACPLSTRLPKASLPSLLRQIGARLLVDASATWDGVEGAETLHVRSQKARGEAWDLSAPATLVFTSGSTGAPKAVLHTIGSHFYSAQGLTETLPLGPGDRWLLDLPLYHVGGLAILFRCILTGVSLVLREPDESAEHVSAEHGVTHVSFVATQLLRVMRAPPSDALATLKVVLLGGSAMPASLVAEAHARGIPIRPSYGLTEMASTVTAAPPGASLDALGTSGVVLPHREVRLSADGEILVRGPALFAGYLEGETLTLPTDADGWFSTGDLGRWETVDGRTMLRVIGRTDNLFISGGENIRPEEIEVALGRIKGVRQAIVVPVSDAEFGHRPVAFVEAERWEPAAWRRALATELPGFKIPTVFHRWPSDAHTGLKVSRSVMRERAEQVPSGM